MRLSLHNRSLLILGGTLAGLVLILYAVSQVILGGDAARAEGQAVQREVRRFQDVLAGELAGLDGTGHDYAVWDDSYAFLESGDPDFVALNLADTTFTNLRLTLIAFVHRQHGLVYAQAFDLAQAAPVAMPAGLAAFLASDPRLASAIDDDVHTTGVLNLPEGVWLVTVHPVLTSEGAGPSRGYLVMGRYLADSEMKRQADLSSLTLAIVAPSEPGLPALSTTPAPKVVAVDDEVIAGYGQIQDLNGQPLLLEVELPRTAYQQSQASIRFFLIALVGVGGIFATVVVWLLERLVIARVARLSRETRQIGASADAGARLVVEGRDELASLAESVNQMLAGLEAAGQAQRIGEASYRELYASAERQAQELRLLNDNYSALAAVTDPQVIAQTVIERLAKAFGYRWVCLALKEGDDLVLAHQRGYATPPERVPLSQGLRGRVARTGQPVFVPDVRQDQDYLNFAGEATSEIAVPLTQADDLLGVLDVAGSATAPLTETDYRLIQAVGAQTSLALARARLYADLAQANVALTQARDQALEAARLKSEFMATMSHEIRTPMNAVLGLTELLRDTALDERQADYVRLVYDSAQALLEIINDILDFSKIEAGKLRLERVQFNPAEVVEGVIEMLAPRARQKGLEFLVYLAPEAAVNVLGDPARLRQVLLNLVGNAIKFTTQGEVAVEVRREQAEAQSASLRFTIRDTGIGLSEATRQRLFQPFTQADGSTTRRYGGTGLGLAIARQLTELMGGEIGVNSVEGQGATFWFTVPFERSGAAVSNWTLAPEELRGLRALIVDDNAASAQILCRYLESWGIAAVEAHTGPEALASLRQAVATGQPYDVALVDLVMRGQDGFALAQAIRQDPALLSLSLLMITSYDEDAQKERALRSGFAAYLLKPVRQSQLLDALTEAVLDDPAARLTYQAAAGARRPAPAVEAPLVLLAEDNPTNQKLAILQLEKLGCQAKAVVDGQQAVDAVRQPGAGFALVLMDVHMPVLDGLSATRAIRDWERQAGGHVRIVAMTANAMPGDRETCLAAGMDDYLSKPLSLAKLRTALEQSRLIAVPASAETPSGPAEMPVIDLGALQEICELRLDEPAHLGRLVDEFLAHAGSLLAQLRHAASYGQLPAGREAAHALKGSSLTVGAQRLAYAADVAEKLARLGETREFSRQVERVTAELDKAGAELLRQVGRVVS